VAACVASAVWAAACGWRWVHQSHWHVARATLTRMSHFCGRHACVRRALAPELARVGATDTSH
jgi:hypothetical protein